VQPFGAPPPGHGPVYPESEWGPVFPNQPPEHAPQQAPLPGAIVHQRKDEPSSPIQQVAEAFQEVPGKFVDSFKMATKRAFRLRIEPSEVTVKERAALTAANPPIVDENLQAFLAWRRSVLFLVATFLTVLSIMGLIDGLGSSNLPGAIRFVKLTPAFAETAFCLICWLSLRNWTNWRKQRRWLFGGWLLFMLSPFIAFVYPLKFAVAGAVKSVRVETLRELGIHGVYNRIVAPFIYAMIAMLQLAPKVISLMPGLIRSSMVIKLLFPGASAPGWLIVMAAPLYAMIAYAILVIPYQFTGEPWFMAGIIGIMVAQVMMTRAGFRLAKPMSQDEALSHIKRTRKFYIVLLLVSLGCIVGGLGLLVKILEIKFTTLITTILKFETNVMILTIIGADLVVTNLDRARGYTEGKEQIEQETELKIAAFVGLNAPSTPPPPGPASY